MENWTVSGSRRLENSIVLRIVSHVSPGRPKENVRC